MAYRDKVQKKKLAKLAIMWCSIAIIFICLIAAVYSLYKSNKKDEAVKANHEKFNQFFHHCLRNGIYLPPSGYETWFISHAIKQNEIEKTLEVIRNF